jgi:glycosyltransferase involved in cell wall biosynthesis
MISVVVPAYNESQIVRSLYERVAAAASTWGDSWELLIVDDGSSDNTFDVCSEIASADPRLKILSFARNFGHQAAVTAGLSYASGGMVAVIDADLQDPPEELLRFINKCREGYDVVYAIRTKRKEGPLKRLAYYVYYRLLKRLSSIDIPLDSGDFCVMTRRIVDVINALPERNRFVRGLRSWSGYRQTGLPYERHARQAGEPKYTFSKLVKLGLDGVFNFSYKPLHILMLIGLTLGTISFAGGFLVFLQYVTDFTIMGYNPRNARGWTSLMIVMLFMAGVQLFGMGLLGEYIGRIFEEIKARPVYIVRRFVNIESEPRAPLPGRVGDLPKGSTLPPPG